MIEELTPSLLSSLLLVVVFTSPVLTLIVSAALLRWYRKAVQAQMELSTAPAGAMRSSEVRVPSGSSSDGLFSRPEPDWYRLARSRIRLTETEYAVAGLAFAGVFAVAASHVYPVRLGLPGTLLTIGFYIWPLVCARLLVLPSTGRDRLLWFSGYVGVLCGLTVWAGTIKDIPAIQFGAVEVPARSSASLWQTGKLWILVNGFPTLLIGMCVLRGVRAVAPLVLTFVTTAITGVLVVFFSMFSSDGAELVIGSAISLDLHWGAIVLGVVLLALVAFGAIAWGLLRVLSHAYRERRISDQSLSLDSLWLLFAVYYSMWLILGGLVWAAAAPIAFVAFKLVLAVTGRFARPGSGPQGEQASTDRRGLTFLRVFALDQRSDRLLHSVAGYWRHIGSVQMITGPDVARSTVAPHQFLDFLSGRLATHFVRDAESLAGSLAQWEREPGQDGRFPLNNFFCHADTWQQTLPWLVGDHDIVLMDLRTFSSEHDGCAEEIEFLAAHVPLGRCLFVVDERTELDTLTTTIAKAGEVINDLRVHHYCPVSGSEQRLLEALCAPIPGPVAQAPTRAQSATTVDGVPSDGCDH